MKKQFFFFLILLIISLPGYSQVEFKHGSFIDERDQRIECLIKDMDWLNNPSEFEYKLSADSEVEKANISFIKEFEIYSTSKYVRALVQIDRSGSAIEEMSSNRNPDFKEELLFLKVLLDSKASLYQYRESSLTRFFYKLDDIEIKQLIFKYFRAGTTIARNEFFKQQLFADLECPLVSKKDFEKIKYKDRDLIRVFVMYNECNNVDYVNFHRKNENNDRIRLNLRPGINFSNLSISHQSTFEHGQNTFPHGVNFRLGIEIEYIFPFNANKWSVIFEPTFRYQKLEDEWETRVLSGGLLIAHVDYKSLELPLGIRYYFHLKNNSKAFVNCSFLKDFPFKSSFDQVRTNGDLYRSSRISSGENLAFGGGYIYKDRIIFEFRYHTARHILNNHVSWDSDFRAISVVLGYTLF